MKRVLSLNVEDLAGLSYTLCKGINSLGDGSSAVSIRARNNWIDYPAQVSLDRDKCDVNAEVDSADVLHLNEWIGSWQFQPPFNAISPMAFLKKHVYIQYHGSALRRDPAAAAARDKRILATGASVRFGVSTPDLIEQCPYAEWLPSPIAVDEYQALRGQTLHTDEPLTMVHCPTNTFLAKTDEVVKVCATPFIAERAKLLTFQRVPHAELLWKKAASDIHIGKIFTWCGVNDLEAMAMGIPTVCSASEWALRWWKEHVGEEVPFVLVRTMKGLESELRRLVSDESYRSETGRLGLQYVRKWHDYRVVAKRFLESA